MLNVHRLAAPLPTIPAAAAAPPPSPPFNRDVHKTMSVGTLPMETPISKPTSSACETKSLTICHLDTVRWCGAWHTQCVNVDDVALQQNAQQSRQRRARAAAKAIELAAEPHPRPRRGLCGRA